MIAEEIEKERIQKAHDQLNNCECAGKSSDPWTYCDPCQEARIFLNSLMKDYDQEEDYDENG